MAETSHRLHSGLQSRWISCHGPILPRIQLFRLKVKFGVRKLLRLTAKMIHELNVCDNLVRELN